MQEWLVTRAHAVPTEAVTGATLLVPGAGPPGLFAIAVARTGGAGTLIATDVSADRLELARKVGADLAFNSQKEDPRVILDRTNGAGIDACLEMSGHPAAVQLCFQYVKNAGRGVLFCIPNAPVPGDLARDVIFKGVRAHGSTARRRFAERDWLVAPLLGGVGSSCGVWQ